MNAARFLRRFAMLLRRRRYQTELGEEMAFHRAEAERELRSLGMPPESARYAAIRQLGNTALIQDRSHGIVGFGLESALADLRYAIRQLWNNPAFTAVMLLTLALSIGANSAIFSVIDGVLLRALPYPHADRLVRLFLSNSTFPKFPLNPFDFRDFRARSQKFESMAVFTRGDMQLSDGAEPVRRRLAWQNISRSNCHSHARCRSRPPMNSVSMRGGFTQASGLA